MLERGLESGDTSSTETSLWYYYLALSLVLLRRTSTSEMSQGKTYIF